ncbi:glycosyltransferase family 4 protein [Ramlibacter algicola]|uniref:Glycosyltransferase family 4 protein n=1 Tax=Ramlibacter algicola TaxID=2795217 RepID=A0A934PX61_9BURK|nr:glycosyltransferase family 4 protein [Ramlibacter algicola]MBK0391275.1 glycosyltransferase family 4 protein [Ramlibacter algicola]
MTAARARILAVSHDTSLYGAQRSLFDVVNGLIALGHDVEVCVPYAGPLSDAFARLGIRVHVVPICHWVPDRSNASARHWLTLVGGLPRRVLRARRLVRTQRFDLVYTNTVTVLEFALAAKAAGVPHVWHLREKAAGHPQLRSPLPNRGIVAIVRALSAKVIYNSHALLARYGGARGAKDMVVHNGLPAAVERPRGVRRADPVKIVSAGFMDHRKGLDVLLDAVALLPAAARAGVRIEVAGIVEPRYMAREIAPRLASLGDAVRLLGWVDPIEAALSDADLLVSSAREEPFGRTLVEAMMLGLPVLATRCGGPEEIVEDGVTGLLVAADDPRALSAALLRLLTEPGLLASFGRAGRERALERFELGACVRRVEACLLEAVHG